MIDDELAATVEEIGERLLSMRTVEDIRLLDTYPGQRTALGGQFVVLAHEVLLACQESAALGEPLLPADDGVGLDARVGHVDLSLVGGTRVGFR